MLDQHLHAISTVPRTARAAAKEAQTRHDDQRPRGRGCRADEANVSPTPRGRTAVVHALSVDEPLLTRDSVQGGCSDGQPHQATRRPDDRPLSCGASSEQGTVCNGIHWKRDARTSERRRSPS